MLVRCLFARELLYLENRQPYNKEDDTRLGHLIVKGSTHMFDKMHLCFDGLCPRNYAQRVWALKPNVCVIWELASIFQHRMHELLSTEYMWKDLDEVEVHVLASPRVKYDVKELLRAELTKRRWPGGCRRAWIAAVVFK
jgi:hypothetical protein